MIMFSVHDSVSNTWQPPILARSESEACRGFRIGCLDPRIPESYLRDISLYRIGEFDENTGNGAFHPPVRIMFGDDPFVIRDRKVFRKSDEAGGNSDEVSE